MQERQKIILDVDTGIDDALAMTYAIRSPELAVLGITTCFGNVTVHEAARNSLLVLEQLDAEHIPVFLGANQPLFRPSLKAKAVSIHGEDGLGDTGLSEPLGSPASQSAASFIVEQARKYPHEVTVVAVGAMTNLALAIMQDPEAMYLLKRVVIMGGAVTVPGNVTPQAEANMYADPEAAEFLFRSGIPVTMVGLDVTLQTLLPRAEIAKWREQGTKLGQFLANITEFYINAYSQFYPGIRGCALHDPLAIGVVIDTTFVKTQPLHVQVDCEGLYSVGRTIADRRSKPDHSPNVDVCLEVDADRFLAHFLERVAR
ncbi:nucleoside hydrolase [Paenibacillus selenitireducens]|uniref:Nucleoside hydrolase n=1 Tax=Paenibacillus selenitireducens TaxID=1324314 RepID=A0A1T2WYW4_9BACL|nr:nucleoside hydrolase [Paenibacillus selenitireducens]OPA72775.1 nucleoside hydrolase [Paenibacillus selenitireducens]